MSLDFHQAVAVVMGVVVMGVVGFILKWAWTSTHDTIKSVKAHADKRVDDATAYIGKAVDDVHKLVDRKADNAELTRVRDAQVAIFDKIEKHTEEDRAQYATIVQGLGKLEGKIDTMLMRKRGND